MIGNMSVQLVNLIMGEVYVSETPWSKNHGNGQLQIILMKIANNISVRRESSGGS